MNSQQSIKQNCRFTFYVKVWIIIDNLYAESFPNGRVSPVAGFKSRVAALKSRIFKSRGFSKVAGFSEVAVFSKVVGFQSTVFIPQWYSFKKVKSQTLKTQSRICMSCSPIFCQQR